MSRTKGTIKDATDAARVGATGGWDFRGHRRQLREALEQCITPADFTELGKALLTAAKAGLAAGEVKQVCELFDRLLGKPAQSVEVDAGENVAQLLERIAAAAEAREAKRSGSDADATRARDEES